MIRRTGSICAVLLASLLLHAAAAYGAPGDPEAGSPSAGIYKLPLEAGREDAAPKTKGSGAADTGDSGGGSGQAEGGGAEEEEEEEEVDASNYRSENNFGSSSQVPGADNTGTGKVGTAGTDGGAGGGTGGGGGASGAEISQTGAAVPPDTGNTSVAGNLALLGAIILFVGGVAIFARRRFSAP